MEPMMRAVLIAVFAVFPLLSCSNATGPIAVVSANVTRVAMGSPGGLEVALDLEMTNATSRAISPAPCAMSLERQDSSGDWDAVWSLACFAITLPVGPMVIPAGESRVIQLHITKDGDGMTWPSVGLEGTYRVQVAFFPDNDDLRRLGSISNLVTAQTVFSNEFVLPVP
jgi:hypothetical protein